MADQNSITSPSVSSSSSSSSSSNNGNGMAMATVTCIPQQPQSQHTNQHQGCSCPHCYNLWRYQQQQQQQHSYSIPPPPAYTNGAEGEVMYNYDGGYGAPVPPPPGTQAYLRRSASWGPRDSMDFQAQAVPFLPQERRAFVFPVQMGQQQQVPMVDFGVYPTTTASVVPPHPQSNYHYNVAQQQQHGSPVQTRSPQLSRPVSIQDQRTSRKAVSSPANFAHDTSAQSTPPVPVSTNSESNSWSFFTTSSVVVPSPPAQDMDMVTSPPPRVNSSMSPAIPTHQLLSSGYPPAPSYVVQTGPSIVVDQRAVDAQAQLSMEIQALVSAQPPPPPKVNTSFSDFSKLTASLVKSGTPSPPPPSRSPLRSSQGSRSPSGTLSSPNSPQRLAEKKKLKKSSRRKSKKSKSRSQKGSKHRSSSSPKQQQKKRRKKQDQGSDAEESEDDSGALSLELQRTNQNRLIWTKELHTLFLSALDQLGIDAMPKAVLAAMNVEGLTRENIASHLQKYRLKLQQEEKRKSVLQATTGNGQGSSTTTTTTTTSTGSSAPAEQTTQPLSEPTPKVSAPSLAMYRDGGFVDGMDLSLSFPGLLGYCSSDEEEEEEWTNANSSVWFNESQVLSASSSTDSTSNIGDSAVIPSFSFMFLDSEDYDRDQRLRPATPEPPPNSSSSSSSSIPRLSLPVSIQRSCSPCSISSSSDNSPTSTPKVGRPELVVRGSI